MFSLIRLSVRSLLRTPVFTTVALVTLALGIGVNTSMFNLLDALLYRPAPFPDAVNIMRVQLRAGANTQSFSEPDLVDIKAQTTALTPIAFFRFEAASLAQPGQPPERFQGTLASPEMFQVIGIQPFLGRAFTQEEAVSGNDNVIVISHGFWLSHFGGATDIVGKTVRMNGKIVTIIGVMPEVFSYRAFWGVSDYWRPLTYSKEQVGQRDYRVFEIIAKLKSGYTPGQAERELEPLINRMSKELPRVYSGKSLTVVPLHRSLMDSFGKKISWMLVSLAGFVLLIACSNLANLQLTRSTARLKDLAIRSALGASRIKLILQQLVECLILSIAGGALGIVVSLWTNSALERNFLINGTDPIFKLDLSSTTLLVTAGISVLTGIAFGIVPAWLASRADMNAALKQQTRGSTGGKGYHRARSALIIGEVALALTLLTGAGVMVQTFSSLLEQDPNWDTHGIVTANISISENDFDTTPKRLVLFDKIQRRLEQIPGVQAAALATGVPVFTLGSDRPVMKEGESEVVAGGHPHAFHAMVTSNYFETLGMKLVSGRNFERDVKPTDPQVVIVNEALARHYWPGEEAVGKRLGTLEASGVVWREVIGVTKDVGFIANPTRPVTTFQLYRPLAQEPWSWITLVVKAPNTSGIPLEMRRAVADIDPDLPLLNLNTIPESVDISNHNLLIVGKVLLGFALLGLVLAAIGIYGVIASVVTQRTSEFGIRLALGAKPSDVLLLVLWQGLRLTTVGLIVGLVGAVALTRFLASIMPLTADYQTSMTVTVTIVLFAVAAFSCWLPAMRATRVDPMIALRAD